MTPTQRTTAGCRRIEFFVPGVPKPKGSWRAVPNFRTGKTFLKPDCPDGVPWGQAVRAYARQAWSGGYIDAACVWMSFFFVRPPSVSKHREMNVKPDSDKLVRAVLDALTGVVYCDDARVVEHHAFKFYGEEPGVNIRIVEIDGRDKKDGAP